MVAELRELAAGIRPAVLTEAGPVAAVHTLLEQTPIPVYFPAAEIPRMDISRESTAYFVVTEALTNALKHARADQVRIEFDVEGDRLHVDVTDNGIGGADIGGGSGLRDLRDRVRALDGELTVCGAPGSGTTVSAVIPLAKQPGEALRERVHIAGPPGGHVLAVLHDESGALVVEPVAGEATALK